MSPRLEIRRGVMLCTGGKDQKMKKGISIIVIVAILMGPTVSAEEKAVVTQVKSYKNPTLSGLFSLVIPGSGHGYQGEWVKGSLFAGVEGAAVSSFLLVRPKDIATSLTKAFSFEVAKDTHLYNVYSSYQDARIRNNNKNYNTPIAKHTLWDLIKSPFSLEYLTRWTFLIPTALSVGVSIYDAHRDRDLIRLGVAKEASFLIPYFGASDTAVGIGEESFFRGFLQPEFTDLFGTPWVGVILQGLIFGPAHINSGIANVVFATAYGLYEGWVTHRNHYDLREGVASHMWWNFITNISPLFYFDKDKGYKDISLSISLPFL